MKTNKRQRRTFIMTKRPRRYNNCYICTQDKRGFPGGSDGKESACNAGDSGLNPGSGRSPGEGNWQPAPVFLPGESHGQESGGLQSMESQRVGHN